MNLRPSFRTERRHRPSAMRTWIMRHLEIRDDAPHVQLERNGERLSTLDLAGPKFSLIGGTNGKSRQEIAHGVGEKTGLDLHRHVIGDNLRDVEGEFNDRFGIGETGAVLVWPDGFIAWRTQLNQPGCYDALRVVLQLDELDILGQ